MRFIKGVFDNLVLFITSAFFLLFVFFWTCVVDMDNFSKKSINVNELTEIEIERGATLSEISNIILKNELIGDSRKFFIYLKYFSGKAKNVQSGHYVFRGEISPKTIVDKIQKGRNRIVKIIIPEGSAKRDITDILEKIGFWTRDEIINATNSYDLAAEFGVPKLQLNGKYVDVPGGIEGYLFPDTYFLESGMSLVSVLKTMNNRLNVVINKDMRKKMKELKISLHELLTIASMVEKETSMPIERPRVAGVFLNRLRLGMKLQTDPTVIYGLRCFSGKIKKKDLRDPHLYNTYVNHGIPPGPIASPGKKSIEAVLWPAKSQDLFFVSKNNGSHVFCPDYTCHASAVKKWQIDFFKDKNGN